MQVFLALVLSLVSFQAPPASANADPRSRSPATSRPTDVEVLFSPKGGCTERIVQEIGNRLARRIDRERNPEGPVEGPSASPFQKPLYRAH